MQRKLEIFLDYARTASSIKKTYNREPVTNTQLYTYESITQMK